jgi:hypothetical protein
VGLSPLHSNNGFLISFVAFVFHHCYANVWIAIGVLWTLVFVRLWVNMNFIPCLLLNCIAINYFKFHYFLHVLLNINSNCTFSSMLCMWLSYFSSSCFLVILFVDSCFLRTRQTPYPYMVFVVFFIFLFLWNLILHLPPLWHLICLNVHIFIIYN